MIIKDVMEKWHSNMNLATYNTIQKVNYASIVGLATAKLFLLNNFSMADHIASILAGLLCAYSISTQISGTENQTSDVKEITNIYNELIYKYNKMSDIFNFNHPVEIYAMFNYLIYEGYLSKNKHLEFNTDEVRNIKLLLGANVISGQVTCTHIASLLKDIYCNKGIESSICSVYFKKPVITILTDDNRPKQTVEELHDFVRKYITNEKMQETFNQIIAETGTNISLALSYKDDKSIITKLTGNHVVTTAVYEKKNYIVDPTQTKMYKQSPTENNTLVDKDNEKIELRGNILASINNTKKEVTMSSTTFDEDFEMVDKTKMICRKNEDIFEQFYHDNNEMYEEISAKLLSMKKI